MPPTAALPVSAQGSHIYAEFPNFCSSEHSQRLTDPFSQEYYFKSRRRVGLGKYAGQYNSLTYFLLKFRQRIQDLTSI